MLYKWNYTVSKSWDWLSLTSSQTVVCVNSLLLFIAESYSIIWMLHSLFNDSHNGCAIWIVSCVCYYEENFYEYLCTGFCVNTYFHYSAINVRVGLQVPAHFIIRNCQFSRMAITFCIPISNIWVIMFLHIFVSIWYCHFLNLAILMGM